MITTIDTFFDRYKTYITPALILLAAVMVSLYISHARSAEAGTTYAWQVTSDFADGQCAGPYNTGGCTGGCGAGNVGETCQRATCSTTPPGTWYTNIECVATGCTPDNSCAANTCQGQTCSDGCGGNVSGTKDCTTTCTMTNACGQSNTGVTNASGNGCSVSAPPVVDACPFDVGIQCDPSQCSGPGPGPGPGPVCAVQTCPPASSICQGNSCTVVASDCSTATVNGTMNCAPGPGPGPGPGCTNPTVTAVASPTRVKSGQTTTITITGTGLTQSCTVTGPGVNQTITTSSCNLNPNPTVITTPAITQQSTYTVTCADIPTPTKVIVNVNPAFIPF